ncbi:WhiB family transcriptional regulator [Actinoallomurus sp. NPDC052308]|uniref:WhiB family transcriptional regulator n=1 Tax=Actinoallomurus sp. NPDC052308 TaxID=3155530 RepID=UPI003412C975
MNVHPSKLATPDLRDECLDGAECLFDPELHDGPNPINRIEHPDARTAREDVAKDVCATCPVQLACLEYAIRTKPARGIWAGATAEEIAELAAFRRQREQGAGDVRQEVA